MKIDFLVRSAICIFSLLAGLFWVWSATAVLARFNDHSTEPPDLERLRQQSRWNAAASICAALAAVVQALVFTGILPGPN